uniref:Uncharacterized protein n=1 Tax=Panagrellus redivivus TaxID=6233 RepID=A0A7E4VQD5_PANRE
MLPDEAKVRSIPDKNWHFCKNINDAIECKIKPSTPMLQVCAVMEVFSIYFDRGAQPRTVLLLKFQHVMGELLFNLTYTDESFYVNGEFYVKVKWEYDKETTKVRLVKGKKKCYVWAQYETTEKRSLGNGGIRKPEHEWVLDEIAENAYPHIDQEIHNCSEVKIKVVEGFVNYRLQWRQAGFATEPYGDDYSTTPPSTTSSEKKKRRKLTPDSTETSKKASPLSVVFYVIAGILLLVATPVLIFVGFRLGKCYAEKTVLKKGLSMNVATSVSNAKSTVDNIVNTETENKLEASLKPREKASSLKEMPTPISETDKNG